MIVAFVPRGTKLSPLEIEEENIVARRVRASQSGKSVAANQSYSARLSSYFRHFRKSRNRTWGWERERVRGWEEERKRYVTECVSSSARAHGITNRVKHHGDWSYRAFLFGQLPHAEKISTLRAIEWGNKIALFRNTIGKRGGTRCGLNMF